MKYKKLLSYRSVSFFSMYALRNLSVMSIISLKTVFDGFLKNISFLSSYVYKRQTDIQTVRQNNISHRLLHTASWFLEVDDSYIYIYISGKLR